MVELGAFRVYYYSIAVLGLNLVTIVLGLTYLIFPGELAVWDLSGWLFLVSWMSTIALSLLAGSIVDLRTPLGKRISHLSYITLAVLGAAAIFMFGASFLLSVAVLNAISVIGGILVLLYGSFFGCTAMNSFFAFIMLKGSKISSNSISPSSKEKMYATENERTKFLGFRKIPFMYIGAMLVCGGAVGGMMYCAILSLAGAHLGSDTLSGVGAINGLIGLISATFGWLFCVLAWAATVGGVKILRRLHLPRFALGFGVLGLITGSILLAPMIAVPLMGSDTNNRFAEAYGSDWETRILPSALPYFKASPLVAAEYFLPQPLDDCVVMENISFHNGSNGNENGLQLFFDAYLPSSTDQPLPGANSSLIRIHGGGFSIGDKGTGNMPLMNRYFASQGYCVFDVQYGLINRSSILSFAKIITPEYVMGNYSINDMVRHIGLFGQYLALHQAEYQANLSSVFVSGGSAGGHLTCVTALAIASGNYTSIFGSGITIRGFVPFYPVTMVDSRIDGGISNQEFYDPISLVSASSPPCLIYHGSQDGILAPQTSQDLKDRYTDQGNPSCMVIFLPFAGHGSDIAFYGYYNQFFLYYMERFMYLYR